MGARHTDSRSPSWSGISYRARRGAVSPTPPGHVLPRVAATIGGDAEMIPTETMVPLKLTDEPTEPTAWLGM